VPFFLLSLIKIKQSSFPVCRGSPSINNAIQMKVMNHVFVASAYVRVALIVMWETYII
jgi:hypothetical protein